MLFLYLLHSCLHPGDTRTFIGSQIKHLRPEVQAHTWTLFLSSSSTSTISKRPLYCLLSACKSSAFSPGLAPATTLVYCVARICSADVVHIYRTQHTGWFQNVSLRSRSASDLRAKLETKATGGACHHPDCAGSRHGSYVPHLIQILKLRRACDP